jgi:hypothetical protein
MLIDEPLMKRQPHPLARTKQRRPIGRRRLPIDQVSVGGTRDIENVGRAHAHLAPLEAVRHCRGEALLLDVLDEGAERTLAVIVIVALEFEIADNGLWTFIGPVREQHDIIVIEPLDVGAFGLDHDRAVNTGLFLEFGMAVIPVGAALMDEEAVHIGLPRRDTRKTQARHAVHR